MLFGEFYGLSGLECIARLGHEMFRRDQDGRTRKEVGSGCRHGGEAASPLGLGRQVVFCFRHCDVCICYVRIFKFEVCGNMSGGNSVEAIGGVYVKVKWRDINRRSKEKNRISRIKKREKRRQALM